MAPILAESLDGWLYAAAAFFGGLIASALALCALIPAWQRNGRLAFALAAPAMVVVVLVTVWVGYGFITYGLRDPDSSPVDFAILWLLFAGPPLAASLLASVVYWFRTRKNSAGRRSDGKFP